MCNSAPPTGWCGAEGAPRQVVKAEAALEKVGMAAGPAPFVGTTTGATTKQSGSRCEERFWLSREPQEQTKIKRRSNLQASMIDLHVYGA